MAPSSPTPARGFRRGLSVRLGRFRRRLHYASDHSSPPHSQTSSPVPAASVQASDASAVLTTAEHDVVHSTRDREPIRGRRTRDDDSSMASSDLWSAAYREAVESIGEDIDVAILMGTNAVQLFEQLEEIDRDATKESAFIRGVAYLRSIQVPLERFKLAVDLASPLGSLDPAAKTVFSVVSGVTAVSQCHSFMHVAATDSSNSRLP